MRLHVDVLGAEQGLGTVDGQALDLIDDLLALVVTRPGIALGILVGDDRRTRLAHSTGSVVLGSDQAHLATLARLFGRQQRGQMRIGLRECCGS